MKHENIYIETLKLGFESIEGITYRDVIDKLKIDIEKNIAFKIAFSKWFFENFETKSSANFPVYDFKKENIDNKLIVLEIEIAFIKGNAVNTYIDYLELERTRKSSRRAEYIAFASLAIAISAVFIPIVFNKTSQPPLDVNVNNAKEIAIDYSKMDSLLQKNAVLRNKTNEVSKIRTSNDARK